MERIIVKGSAEEKKNLVLELGIGHGIIARSSAVVLPHMFDEFDLYIEKNGLMVDYCFYTDPITFHTPDITYNLPDDTQRIIKHIKNR